MTIMAGEMLGMVETGSKKQIMASEMLGMHGRDGQQGTDHGW